MKRLRSSLLMSAIALSLAFAGCGGSGAAPVVKDLPPSPGEMESSNYHCEAGSVTWGGGTSSSTDKVCIGTVLSPFGNAINTTPDAGHNLQAGFQNFVAARTN